MSLLHNNTTAFGLDISDLILRAVQFKGQGRNLAIEAYNQIEVPEGIIKNGEILEPRTLTDIIKKMISHPKYGRFSTKRVIASLPERKSFIKVAEIPQVDNTQLTETIRWEISQHIPLSPEDMYFDWHMMKTGEPANKLKIIISAIPKNIADSYTAVLEDADLKPVGLIIESMAIANCLISPTEEKNISALILDLGLRRTTFLIFNQGVVRLNISTNNISGQDMTKLISQKLHLSSEQAEEAKRLCGLDPTRGRAAIPRILSSYIDQIEKEINRILNYYQTHYPSAPQINEIILVGGGANLRNIPQELNKRINIKIIIGNPFIRFEHLKKNKIIPAVQQLSHPTVFGLAIMGSSKTLIK